MAQPREPQAAKFGISTTSAAWSDRQYIPTLSTRTRPELTFEHHVRQRHLPRPPGHPLPTHRGLGETRHLQRGQSHQHRALLYGISLPIQAFMNLCRSSLTLLAGLGVLPGLFHAWYIIAVTPDPTYIQLEDTERGQGGHVTYYYVQTQGQPKYGTVNSTPDSQFPNQQQGFVQPQAPEGSSAAAASSSGDAAPPPSYQQAVGDNKVQHP